jgi:hypothetical protein
MSRKGNKINRDLPCLTLYILIKPLKDTTSLQIQDHICLRGI